MVDPIGGSQGPSPIRPADSKTQNFAKDLNVNIGKFTDATSEALKRPGNLDTPSFLANYAGILTALGASADNAAGG